MSKFSILHISDLHKPNGLTYATLFDSLCDDKERWKQEGIKFPDFIVVSGDLIQGASSDEEIINQYNDVSSFLDMLVGEFLGGDKTRLIMVPGNHDINRVISSGSMNEIESPNENELKTLKKVFWKPENMIRFDWKSMHFFQINDISKYNERFCLFKQFYDNFYSGLREFPTNSTKEALVFPFETEHIAFACFNSCNFLDDKNFAGNIDEESITSISSHLRKFASDGYLIIGVWHHHYYGDPYTVNYMSRDVFFPMQDKGIRIGLFGHQHISEVADEFISPFYVDDSQRKKNTMLLISSGTLFGGEKQLQPGFRRQYNIIEIDRQGLDSRIYVSINVREDNSRKVNSKIPFWAFRPIPSSNDNKIHKQVYVRELNLDEVLLQIKKDADLSRDYEHACNVLTNLNLEDRIVRDLFDDLLQKCSLPFQIKLLQKIVINSQETIILLYAILNERDKVAAQQVQGNDRIRQFVSSDKLLGDIWEKIYQLIS